MSIRPMDMQIAVQRSGQYIRESNHSSQVGNNQQGIALETQKQAIQHQSQVTSAEASKQGIIDEDSANKSGYGGNTRDRNPETRKKGGRDVTLPVEEDKGAFIDIII